MPFIAWKWNSSRAAVGQQNKLSNLEGKMAHKRILFLISVLFVASLLLAACAGLTKVPVAPTVIPAEPAAITGAETVPAYKDPEARIEDRVEDLLSRMTLAEKIGQMTQVEKNSIR
jgi:hypothetical protein